MTTKNPKSVSRSSPSVPPAIDPEVLRWEKKSKERMERPINEYQRQEAICDRLWDLIDGSYEICTDHLAEKDYMLTGVGIFENEIAIDLRKGRIAEQLVKELQRIGLQCLRLSFEAARRIEADGVDDCLIEKFLPEEEFLAKRKGGAK